MSASRTNLTLHANAVRRELDELARRASIARDDAEPGSGNRADFRGATRYLEKALAALEGAIGRLEG